MCYLVVQSLVIKPSPTAIEMLKSSKTLDDWFVIVAGACLDAGADTYLSIEEFKKFFFQSGETLDGRAVDPQRPEDGEAVHKCLSDTLPYFEKSGLLVVRTFTRHTKSFHLPLPTREGKLSKLGVFLFRKIRSIRVGFFSLVCGVFYIAHYVKKFRIVITITGLIASLIKIFEVVPQMTWPQAMIGWLSFIIAMVIFNRIKTIIIGH